MIQKSQRYIFDQFTDFKLITTKFTELKDQYSLSEKRMQTQLDEHRNDFVNYKGRIELQISDARDGTNMNFVGKISMLDAHVEGINKKIETLQSQYQSVEQLPQAFERKLNEQKSLTEDSVLKKISEVKDREELIKTALQQSFAEQQKNHQLQILE